MDSCISFYSYIKPQLVHHVVIVGIVVYRSIPTSNRNVSVVTICVFPLYIVLFLHQTATPAAVLYGIPRLYIVLFLHQTATTPKCDISCSCCISFYSYIKPQLVGASFHASNVVYRSIPTSNRNFPQDVKNVWWLYIVLFLHQTATLKPRFHLCRLVVYRSIPTSNRNSPRGFNSS